MARNSAAVKKRVAAKPDEWISGKERIEMEEERKLKELTVSIRMSFSDKEKLTYIKNKFEFDSNTDTIRWVIRIIYLVMQGTNNFVEFLRNLGKLIP